MSTERERVNVPRDAGRRRGTNDTVTHGSPRRIFGRKERSKRKSVRDGALTPSRGDENPQFFSDVTLVVITLAVSKGWKGGGGGGRAGAERAEYRVVKSNGEGNFRLAIDPTIWPSFGETYPPAAGGRNFRNIRPTNHSRPSNQPPRAL